MELKLDLHLHSAASADGRMTVEQIVAEARKRGLNGVAITDHNVRYVPADPADAARGMEIRDGGFVVIAGEEFFTEYGHLVGLFMTEAIPTDADRGGPVNARLPFAEAAEKLRAQGALAILAHPFERSPSEQTVEGLLPMLDAVEAFNARAAAKYPDANDRAAAFAAAHGLPVTAGSDAHLPREVGNGYTVLEAEALTPEAIRAAILRPGNPCHGQEGRRTDAARSQFTRLRRAGVGPLRWGAWLLYAGRCLLRDLTRKRRRV